MPQASTRTIGASTYVVRGYRPRVEEGFARIERWRETVTGDVHWRTITRTNVTSLYGQDGTSRIADPDDPGRIFRWLIDLSFDGRGNVVRYIYKAEDSSGAPNAANEAHRVVTANRYLKRVLYGNDVPYLPSAGLELADIGDPDGMGHRGWLGLPKPIRTGWLILAWPGWALVSLLG